MVETARSVSRLAIYLVGGCCMMVVVGVADAFVAVPVDRPGQPHAPGRGGRNGAARARPFGGAALGAGFGAAGGKEAGAAAAPPLKPKQQWDRFLALGARPKDGGAAATTVRVAVRRDGAAGEVWLEVGLVRCEAGVEAASAVTRQRSLIADHARRLHPLKISKQDRVVWGYCEAAAAAADDDDDDDAAAWTAVDPKATTAAATAGLEKRIGFEGTPDPATGFYCSYNGGRLVASGSGGAEAGGGVKPQSKRKG